MSEKEIVMLALGFILGMIVSYATQPKDPNGYV